MLRTANASNDLKSAYRLFQGGKFADAQTAFNAILKQIPLIVVDSKEQGNELKEVVNVCREYVRAKRVPSEASAERS